MTAAEEERIRQLVEELDRLIPRAGACVLLEVYGGGPDEGRLIANQTGYFRFGIELLKGGLAPYESQDAVHIAVDLKYLVSENSVIGFGEILRDDRLTNSQARTSSGRDWIGLAVGIGVSIGCFSVVIFAVVGIVTIMRALGWIATW